MNDGTAARGKAMSDDTPEFFVWANEHGYSPMADINFVRQKYREHLESKGANNGASAMSDDPEVQRAFKVWWARKIEYSDGMTPFDGWSRYDIAFESYADGAASMREESDKAEAERDSAREAYRIRVERCQAECLSDHDLTTQEELRAEVARLRGLIEAHNDWCDELPWKIDIGSDK